MSTTFIDLDAVVAEETFGVTLDGVSHSLVLASVDDFLENTKLINSMTAETPFEEQVNITIGMLARSFPSIGEARLRKLTFPQLKKINDFARSAGGEKATPATTGEAPAEGNEVAAS